MRATVMRNRRLVVDNIPVPDPGPGEVLVKTLACGICGSDLHALKFADKLVEGARRSCRHRPRPGSAKTQDAQENPNSPHPDAHHSAVSRSASAL